MRLHAFACASASLVAIAAGGVAPAIAQTAAAPPVAEGRQVEEIIVTAQKRAQSLEQVPIVVTALTAQSLQDAGVKDIKDLQVLTPGLTVTSTSNETITTARIRGVGTVGDNPGLESSVGVVIDGVYRPRNGVSFGDLGALERIEVLKGPQGTLFGKSTSAGVINILTAKPKFDFHAGAEFTAGEYGTVGGSAYVTGPLVADKLAASLFFAARRRDGYLDVVTGKGPRTETQDNDQNFETVRAQLVGTPSPEFDFRAIVDYTKREENCCAGVQISEGTAANSRANLVNATQPGSVASQPLSPYDRVAYSNRSTAQNIEDRGVSLEANYKTPVGPTVTNIISLRNWKATTGQDSDFTAADITYRPTDGRNSVEFNTFTEEARIAGTSLGDRLNWLVGAFYANETLTRNDAFLYGADYYSYFAGKVLGGAPGLIGVTPAGAFQAGAGAVDTYRQEDETSAVFTNNTFDITKSWDVTIGARYTHDDKTLTSAFNTTGGSCDRATPAYVALVRALGGTAAARASAGAIVGGLCLTWENQAFDRVGRLIQQKTEDQVSGTVKTSYRITPDYMVYLSYAKGYKAGGFNLDRTERTVVTATGPAFVPNTNTHFSPERANSYEAGTKLKFFHKSLLVNATAFYQDFSQFQLNIFLGTTFTVKSMPRVYSRGLDLDTLWITPIEGLSMQGGVTYAETQYSNHRPAGDPDFCQPGDVTSPSCGANAATGGSLYRLPGSRLSFAPLWSASYAVTYEHPLVAGLVGRANLSAKFTSKYNTGSDLQPIKNQAEFFMLNGRIGVGPKSDRWSVEVYAQNLLDKNYKQVAFKRAAAGHRDRQPDDPNLRRLSGTAAGLWGSRCAPNTESTPTGGGVRPGRRRPSLSRQCGVAGAGSQGAATGT